MKYIGIICLLSFNTFLGFSQPIVEWSKNHDYTRFDEFDGHVLLDDGSVIAAGSIYNNNITETDSTKINYNRYGYYKFDCNGNVLWQILLPNIDAYTSYRLWAIKTSNKNEILLYGREIVKTDVQYQGRYQGFLMLIDSDGNMLKQKKLVGSSDVFLNASSVVLEADGTFTLGVTVSQSTKGDFQVGRGLLDIWVVRIDKNLNVIFKKNFGGSDSDGFSSIIKSKDNGYILTGSTYSRDGDFSNAVYPINAYVLKLNEFYSVQWSKTIGGNVSGSLSSNASVGLGPVIEMPDRSIIAGGSTTLTDGVFQGRKNRGFDNTGDLFIALISPGGALSWVQVLDFTTGNVSKIATISQILPIDSTNFLVMGWSLIRVSNSSLNRESQVWLSKMNTNAKVVWKKNYPDPNGGRAVFSAYQISQTQDKGYLITGQSDYSDSLYKRGSDFWLLKLSPLETQKLNDCKQFTLYPNPTAQDISLKAPEYIKPGTQIQVTDVLGRNIYRSEVSKSCKSFDVSLPQFMAGGLYFMQLESNSKVCAIPFVKVN